MIFLSDDGHHELGEAPTFVQPPTPNTKFLFDTNERRRKSVIAVTYSKQTTVFLLNTNQAEKISDIAVTHSKSTTAPFSIRYKWKLQDSPPLSKKIANSALRTPRA